MDSGEDRNGVSSSGRARAIAQIRFDGRHAACFPFGAGSSAIELKRAGVAPLCALAICSVRASAESPQQIIDRYADGARQENPNFAGFSPERGRAVYFSEGVIRGVGIVSCASCHLPDPADVVIAHKSKVLCRACHVIYDEEHPYPEEAKKRKILPMAHSVNSKRYTDYRTVEDFLARTCVLVFKRECTAREKGDVLTWLSMVK